MNTDKTLLTHSDPGQVLYLRLAERPDNPAEVLANQTIYLAQGATMDVLADRDSCMGMDRVRYTLGLMASRKVRGEVITYRFKVPENAPRGSRYSVHCVGTQNFSFSVQVK